MDRTAQYQALIQDFSNRLPKFPDGRINYSGSKEAPVVTVFIEWDGKILLLKRSSQVSTYQGKWNTVAGYIDELVPLEEIVLKELREEIGVERENIAEIAYGEPVTYHDSKIDRTWIIHPEIVRLKHEPSIKLDFEHTEYKWIEPGEVREYDTVENLHISFERVKNV